MRTARVVVAWVVDEVTCGWKAAAEEDVCWRWDSGLANANRHFVSSFVRCRRIDDRWNGPERDEGVR